MQAHQSPPKVTVAELLQQLTVTQAELENIKVRYDLFIISYSKNLALTNMTVQRYSRLIENFISCIQDEGFPIAINIFQIKLLVIFKRFKPVINDTVFFSEFIIFVVIKLS